MRIEMQSLQLRDLFCQERKELKAWLDKNIYAHQVRNKCIQEIHTYQWSDEWLENWMVNWWSNHLKDKKELKKQVTCTGVAARQRTRFKNTSCLEATALQMTIWGTDEGRQDWRDTYTTTLLSCIKTHPKHVRHRNRLGSLCVYLAGSKLVLTLGSSSIPEMLLDTRVSNHISFLSSITESKAWLSLRNSRWTYGNIPQVLWNF